MELGTLLTDDDAVSPVIGVILMVAITVILAAVIGTFVLGLGNNIQQSAPQATFEINDTQPGTGNDVAITHSTGDGITASQLTITGDLSSTGSWDTFDGDISSGDTVSAGDTAPVTTDSTSAETIRIVWNADDGDNSATLQTFEINQ